MYQCGYGWDIEAFAVLCKMADQMSLTLLGAIFYHLSGWLNMRHILIATRQSDLVMTFFWSLQSTKASQHQKFHLKSISHYGANTPANTHAYPPEML